MNLPNKYDFSFTAASLRLPEMIMVARHLSDGKEVDYVNDIGNGKSKTGKRMLAEFTKRIAQLTPQQLEILTDGSFDSQRQIAFLSVCKTHDFIRDFTVDVLREKLQVYDYNITEGNYISFFRRKMELHTEMEELSDLSVAKVKQVTFKILEQSGIIDSTKTKVIQPQLLEPKLIKSIINDNPQWLKVFLLSDMDIENLIQ